MINLAVEFSPFWIQRGKKKTFLYRMWLINWIIQIWSFLGLEVWACVVHQIRFTQTWPQPVKTKHSIIHTLKQHRAVRRCCWRSQKKKHTEWPVGLVNAQKSILKVQSDHKGRTSQILQKWRNINRVKVYCKFKKHKSQRRYHSLFRCQWYYNRQNSGEWQFRTF